MVNQGRQTAVFHEHICSTVVYSSCAGSGQSWASNCDLLAQVSCYTSFCAGSGQSRASSRCLLAYVCFVYWFQQGRCSRVRQTTISYVAFFLPQNQLRMVHTAVALCDFFFFFFFARPGPKLTLTHIFFCFLTPSEC